MKLTNDKSLNDFSALMLSHGFKIYVVGGFVRGKLQGLSDEECGDIDICSKATIDDIVSVAVANNFQVEVLNRDLGVCQIFYGSNIFEHATFRTEICDHSGRHCPKRVNFVEDLELDAQRRDFTINAIYYDPSSGEIIDPVGGVDDLDHFKIKAIGDPNTRILEDAERMLRAVRFACSYAFDIDADLLKAIEKNAKLVSAVKPWRRAVELCKILYVDRVCPSLTHNSKMQMNGIIMLNDLQLLKYILPELSAICENGEKGAMEFRNFCVRLSYCDENARYALLFSSIIASSLKLKMIKPEDVASVTKYLIETYYKPVDATEKNRIILQKCIKYCVNFTYYGLNSKEVNEFIAFNNDIIKIVLSVIATIGFAKSAGADKGKLYEKLYKAVVKIRKR